MFSPDCDNCKHFNECDVRKALKELRETIFNIGREKAGRTTFIYNGELVEVKDDAAD